MPYGQKNYGQKLGNGTYSIAEAGCFLVSFSNLLERWGKTVDPETLNSYFIAHNTYLRDNDGAMEDLAWGSVAAFDGRIAVSQVGGASIPPSADAIVKFIYRSAHTGATVTHFCLVSRIENGQLYIIDSYDGIEKSPSQYQGVYGTPKAWATYILHEAHPVTPVTAPAMAPTTGIGQPYSTVVDLPGYPNANDAANRMGSNSTVPKGDYMIFNEVAGMVNITRKPGSPGWWINPGDNVAPATPAPAAPTTPQLSSPPSAPIPIPGNTQNVFNLIKQLPGYRTSGQAAARVQSTVNVPPGQYYVYNQYNGMVNVTKKPGTPGAWINPNDNVDTPPPPPAPEPTPPAPVATPAPSTEAKPAPAPTPGPNSWKASYKAHPEKYIALKTMVIKDADGKHADVILRQYDEVDGAGTIEKDGELYVRTVHSVENGLYYLVPLSVLELESEAFDASTTTASRAATNTLKPYDHFVMGLATVEGLVERLTQSFKKVKIKK